MAWLALVLASALVVVVSFPPHGMGALMLIGLAPLFIALDRASSWRAAAFRAWLFGFIANFLTVLWVPAAAQEFAYLSAVPAWFSLVLLSAVEQSSWAVLAALRYVLHRHYRVHPLFWTPATILILEALWPKFFPTTFGATFYNLPWLAQAADLTGVWGLTALIAATNEAFAAAIGAVLKKPYWPAQAMKRHVLATLVLLALVFVYGGFRHATVRRWMQNPVKHVRVAIVQPSLNAMAEVRKAKDKASRRAQILANMLTLTERAVAEKPDFIFWPETGYPDTYHNRYNAREATYVGARLDEFLMRHKTPLVFGARDMAADGRWFNAIQFVTPKKRALSVDVYHKHLLLPLAEDVPFAGLSVSFDQFMAKRGAAFFARGDGPKLFAMGETLFGPMICVEGLHPRYVREIAVLGAQILLNATNDAWFGDTAEPSQHLYLTAFRSIETRRPMIRAATAGYSAVIDIDGSVRAKTKLFEEVVVIEEVPVYHDITTPFMAIKDALLVLSALYAASVFIRAVLRARVRTR